MVSDYIDENTGAESFISELHVQLSMAGNINI